MSVTAHAFAFDPVRSGPPSVDHWLQAGALDEELRVQRAARGWLKALPTPFEQHRAWDDNLAGDWAWTRARAHLPAELRAALDPWLSHLFWEAPPGQGCPCGRFPQHGLELTFDADLLAHVLALQASVEAVAPALRAAFPDDAQRFHRPWIYEPEGFADLVQRWTALLQAAQRAGPGWSLHVWVWR